MVAGQEEQCRPRVHLFVTFKRSPKFLPESHRMAASFAHVRDSSSAKGNLSRADTRLGVETENLCRKDLSESVNLPEDQRRAWSSQSQTRRSQDLQRCQAEGLSSFGGCGSPQESAAKLLTQAYLQPVQL